MKNKLSEQVKEESISISGGELKTSARRARVADLILKGHKKDDIVQRLMDEYNQTFKWAVSEYRQGFVYLFLESEATKKDIKELNLARLEELYQRAEKEVEKDEMSKKDFFSTQMKNIDLVNKTAGVYEPDTIIAEGNDINFNLNIGGDKKND